MEYYGLLTSGSLTFTLYGIVAYDAFYLGPAVSMYLLSYSNIPTKVHQAYACIYPWVYGLVVVFITFVLLVSNKATKIIQHISYLCIFILKLSFVVLPHSIMV